MKVVYIITHRNESILHVGEALARLGIQGIMVGTDAFHTVCSYWEHKLDKWGFHGRQQDFMAKQAGRIRETIEGEQPEAVLFVNTGDVRHIQSYVELLSARCRLAMYLVDSVSGDEAEMRRLSFPGNHIYVYEPTDVESFARFGQEAVYCPVGYNEAYAEAGAEPGREQDLDICFAGSPTGERLELLEQLAAYGIRAGWRMLFLGPFYEERYFWKKLAFRHKYPAISQVMRNGIFSSKELADLYRRARICLNIQGTGGRNLNPRTFEILAAGGFELITRHGDYLGLVEPGRDLADFEGVGELIGQADYYLEHEEERQGIAARGREAVLGRLDMASSLRLILGLGL